MTECNDVYKTSELADENLTSIVIGLIDAVRWQDDILDISPFPEDELDMRIPGQGIVYAAEHFKRNGKKVRAISGVIESHYSTSKWEFVLERYKEYMKIKGKEYSYIFILVNSSLVYHEVIAGNLI